MTTNHPEPYIMAIADLYQIIYFAASANDGVGAGAAIDAGAGSDFDIIADEHAPELGDFDNAAAPGRKAESILPDMDAAVQQGALADDGGG